MLLTQRTLPDRAAFHYNRGNRLRGQGEFEAAIKSYYKSLQINPENADTFYNLGLSLQENRDIEKAIESYNRALSIKPDYQPARSQKLHQKARICNWIGIENDKKLMLKIGTNTQEIVPFGHLALEDCPNRHPLRSELHSNNTYHQRPLSIISRPLEKPELLRIGYFSSDFCEHPVAYSIAKCLNCMTENILRFMVTLLDQPKMMKCENVLKKPLMFSMMLKIRMTKILLCWLGKIKLTSQ